MTKKFENIPNRDERIHQTHQRHLGPHEFHSMKFDPQKKNNSHEIPRMSSTIAPHKIRNIGRFVVDSKNAVEKPNTRTGKMIQIQNLINNYLHCDRFRRTTHYAFVAHLLLIPFDVPIVRRTQIEHKTTNSVNRLHRIPNDRRLTVAQRAQNK